MLNSFNSSAKQAIRIAYYVNYVESFPGTNQQLAMRVKLLAQVQLFGWDPNSRPTDC